MFEWFEGSDSESRLLILAILWTLVAVAVVVKNGFRIKNQVFQNEPVTV